MVSVEELPVAQDVKITLVKSRTERPVTIPKGIESPEMENKATFVRREGWCPAGLEELGLSGGLF